MHRARWCRPGRRPASRRGQLADKTVKLAKTKASAALLPPVGMDGESLESVYQFAGDDAADMCQSMTIAGERSRSLDYLWRDNRLPRSLAPLCIEYLRDPDPRQRGVDPNAKSADHIQQFQLPATTPHNREVVTPGGHQALVRPSKGCANAEASVAGPYPAYSCRPPSAPCGVDAGPTSWTAVPTWHPLDGHAPPPKRTSPASCR